MSVFVRMIYSEACWRNQIKFITDPAHIEADAISELKSSKNSLSVWKVEDRSIEQIRIAALALSSSFSNLGNLLLVGLDDTDIQNRGIHKVHSPGDANTNAKGYDIYHYNLVELNHKTLGECACIIAASVDSHKAYLLEKDKIVELLFDALCSGIVDWDTLANNMKQGLSSRIQKLRLLEKDGVPQEIVLAVKKQLQMNKKSITCPRIDHCEHFKQDEKGNWDILL